MLRVKFRLEKTEMDDMTGQPSKGWNLVRLYFYPRATYVHIPGTNQTFRDDTENGWRREYIYRSDPITANECEFECSVPTHNLYSGKISLETKIGGFAGFLDRNRWEMEIPLGEYIKNMGTSHRKIGRHCLVHTTVLEQRWDLFRPIQSPGEELALFCELQVQAHLATSSIQQFFITHTGRVLDNETNEFSKMTGIFAETLKDNRREGVECAFRDLLPAAVSPNCVSIIVPAYRITQKPAVNSLEIHFCKTTMKTRRGPYYSHRLFDQEIEHLQSVSLDIKDLVDRWDAKGTEGKKKDSNSSDSDDDSVGTTSTLNEGYVINSPKAIVLRPRKEPEFITVPVVCVPIYQERLAPNWNFPDQWRKKVGLVVNEAEVMANNPQALIEASPGMWRVLHGIRN